MWISILIKIGKKIPPWIWLSLGVVGSYLLIAWCAYGLGKREVQALWDADKASMQAQIEQLSREAKTVNTKIETVVVERVRTVKEKARVIEKEIPVFIPSDSCELPGGFRLLHDAAASSTIPDRSRIADSAPVPVEDATTTVAENYEQCLVWREELIGWQYWYEEQSALWNQKPSP